MPNLHELYIDGKWTVGGGASVIDVVNPATEEVIGQVPQATSEDVNAAIAAARRAFDDGPWPRTAVHERAEVLRRMGEILQRRSQELVTLLVGEAGATQMQARQGGVEFPISHILDLADRILPAFAFETGVLPRVGPGIGQGVVLREPMGVASLITPYNLPITLNLFKVGPALAAGCTVILKPSPYTPLEALILGEVADEADLPPGVLNIVTGDVDAGLQLTTNPNVDMVSFTGSDTVGRKIAAQAASSVKKVVLELGGKSANILCDDTDLDRALMDVVQNFTFHCGQGCGLLTRVLVHESLHDELVGRIEAVLDSIVVGDGADPRVTMGPLISEAQRHKVESLIRAGRDEGATLAYGGGRPDGLSKGYFVEPTLFVNVDNAMTIAQREFFGPVGVVIPFRSDEEAIELANASDYGLCGGVWSSDPARAYGIAQRVRTGMVSINGGEGFGSPNTPFGGYKQSGLGREWGAAGLSEYLQHKSVVWGAGGFPSGEKVWGGVGEPATG